MLKFFSVADAVKAVNGTFIGDEENLIKRVSDVVIDSRKVSEGTLFVAIPGERVDGHDFIKQVLHAGAVAAISEKKLADEIRNYILVSDTKKALRDLATYYRSILDIKVVGITGSVGKTSTKEMISKVLSEKYNVQKTAGNFNNEIGVPLTIFTITEEHEIAVCEMGISDFGEMDRLSTITKPDVMVITNIGQCHLEALGDRDGVFRAKTECFDHLSPNAKVVLNGNDDKLINVQSVNGLKPYFFGVNETEDENNLNTKNALFSCATNTMNNGLAGSETEIIINQSDKNCENEYICKKVHIPVAGKHMVINAAAAAAVGTLFGMTLDEIAAGIEKCEAVAGRGKLVQTDMYLLVDDTYNANPVSMKAEIELLSKTKGRRVAILGDMFELGTNENELHFEVGQFSVGKCDLLICIGKLSANMYEGAIEGKKASNNQIDCVYFETKSAFIEKKNELLKCGDTILLKASHGMEFGELLDVLSEDK